MSYGPPESPARPVGDPSSPPVGFDSLPIPYGVPGVSRLSAKEESVSAQRNDPGRSALHALIGYGIVGAALMVQQWRYHERTDARLEAIGERVEAGNAAALRDANGERADGDPPPAFREPSGPDAITVRAGDLARAYRDDPRTASRAYDGALVAVRVTHWVRTPDGLGWHVGDPAAPPVVRFAFDVPPPMPADRLREVWVVGTCAGAVRDGMDRNHTGYDFCVMVTGCRIEGE